MVLRKTPQNADFCCELVSWESEEIFKKCLDGTKKKKVFAFPHLSQIFGNHLGEILLELCGTDSADGMDFFSPEEIFGCISKRLLNPTTLFYYCFSSPSKYPQISYESKRAQGGEKCSKQQNSF